MEKQGIPDGGESILAAAGLTSQALIATETRLFVVKVGVLAGSTGGGRYVGLHYSDVTAIQTQLGIMNGTLSVQAPGYGATQTGDFWSSKNQQDPLKLPNVISWSKMEDKKFADELAYMRQRIQESKGSRAVAATPGAAPAQQLTEELERIAALHAQGHLTDDEFAAAKSKLFGL